MKISAVYIRVSTDGQMEQSPESQLAEIRKFAAKNDYLIPDVFIFAEQEGVSGKNADKRPEFQRMIGVAKSGDKPFEVILVWKYSRFARNRQDSIVYKRMLRKQLGIEVISVNELARAEYDLGVPFTTRVEHYTLKRRCVEFAKLMKTHKCGLLARMSLNLCFPAAV